jgi:hypothetical protein
MIEILGGKKSPFVEYILSQKEYHLVGWYESILIQINPKLKAAIYLKQGMVQIKEANGGILHDPLNPILISILILILIILFL